MTVAFASDEKRATWIQNHAVSAIKPFTCFGTTYKFLLIEDQDPDMPIWIGYNETLKAFYISNVGTRKTQQQLLRMECTRLFWSEDHSHIHAVQQALRDTKGKFRQEIIKLMHEFYRGYATQLANLPEYEMSDDLKDIRNTAKYLESLT